MDTPLSTFEQLPCERCGFRGSDCTCNAKPVAPPAAPPGHIVIPERADVLKGLQGTFEKVMAEQERCRVERDALNARLSWLADYETVLRNAIYALEPEEERHA